MLEQMKCERTRPVDDCKARPSKTEARLLEDSSAPLMECPNGTCTVSFIGCGKRQGLGAGSLRKPTVHTGLVYRTAVFVVVRGVISIVDVQSCSRSVIQLDMAAACKSSPFFRLERKTPLSTQPAAKRYRCTPNEEASLHLKPPYIFKYINKNGHHPSASPSQCCEDPAD